MRNGEGAERAANTVTTTSQLQLQLASEEELDDAASSDNNSFSFEEEGSEFERYCSANSAMGTASLSSSMGTCNDFLDSDSVSIKSLGFGRSNFFGEGNNSKRRIRCKAQEEQDIDGDAGYNNNNGVHRRGEASWRLKNWSNSFRPTSSSLMGMGFPSSEQSNTGVGTKPSPQTSFIDTTTTTSSSSHLDNNKYDENEFNSLFEPRASQAVHQDSFSEQHEHVDFSRLTSEAASCLFDGSHSVQYEDTSFKPQHSDDDGSLCSYGTDDERRTDLYEKINSHYWQKPQNAAQNPLHINSAVAFGSDDWDEFIQESEHNSLGAIPLHKFQEKQQTHTQGVLVNSASKAPKANLLESELEQIMRNATAENCPLNNTNEYKEGVGSRLARKDLLTHEANKKIGLNIIHGALQHTSNDEVNCLEEGDTSENIFLRNSKLQDPLSDITTSHPSSSATEELQVKEAVLFEGHEVNVRPPALDYTFNFQLKTMSADSHTSVDQVEAHRANLAPIKVGNPGSNESYDEVVLEMEEILLDSTESHGARFPQSSTPSLAYISQPFRDGSSTASTSGTKEVYSLSQHSVKVDWIEVVGAKQQKGDVSFGERLVGVKEYTMYSIKVWSGKDQWEIERRYRDFFTLYRQLKRLFADHGWVLPLPWSRVEQESRKIFGNASPDVVSQRSILIQECLRSILYSGCPTSTHSVLVWFLSPQKVSSSPSMSKTLGSVPELAGVSCEEDVSTLGKTVSLLVGIQPKKSVKQLLEAQHYCCAGCHKRLDTEKTLVREFMQTLGWGKPRLCEYTGQLFCASCHTNDIAVLPAKVLHFWDFTEYPVSQLAKSYLESIFDQPMLCASAVNPFLFSKVPALLHVMSIRKKIGAMMPYVRCPFRRSIQRGVGSRRYLLEINEFFALRDLVDLSKGAFSGLPVMVETIFEKILQHITQQCLVCCDVGVPCGARQACEDPSSLIFPFQEDEVERCSYCQIAFHKPCFRLLSQCPCGAKFKRRDGAGPSCQENLTASSKFDETLNISPGKTASVSSLGFLSNLFSKATQDKLSGVKKSNPIIPVGSLPSTFSDPL